MKLVVLLLVIATLSVQVACLFDHERSNTLVPKPCSNPKCPNGHCLFENCKVSSPLSCDGGACEFRNCAIASCNGGGCSFITCANPSCNGGNCAFTKMETTLVDGYCDGGMCTLEGRPFQNKFAGTLSM